MAWKCIDIGDQLHLTGSGRSPTNPLVKGDHQTSMTALIGPDPEQVRLGHAVKSDPIEPRITMKNLAGQSGHQSDLVTFSIGEALDGFAQVIIVNAHWAKAIRSKPLNRDGRAFATTDTDRGNSALEAALFQCIKKRHHDPRP